ncbi:IS630 family transposase, partial [Burkholderia ubonensis]|uniref:IS630 family transposase n=1 Tax=Burkholderia ubonensis TaxID=101571 RepID=UPI000A9210DD
RSDPIQTGDCCIDPTRARGPLHTRTTATAEGGADTATVTVGTSGAADLSTAQQTQIDKLDIRIMKLLGFTAQKPLYQTWQQDATLVRQWEFETYSAIRTEARKVGATIYFADESGIRSDYHTGTTWARQGCTPVVEATGKRFSLNMISAVGPQGQFRFMVHDGTVTATVFRKFLGRLMIGAQRPIFLVLDGHPIHKAKLVQDFVQAQKGRLKLYYLPPYSPHLNPDEQVWAHVKRSVSKRLVQTKDEMKRLAIGALRRIQKLSALVKSFSRQPECQYAAM